MHSNLKSLGGSRLFKRYLKTTLSTTLVLALLFAPGTGFAELDPVGARNKVDMVQIRGGISFGERGDDIIPSLSLRDASVVDVLYSLAEQAGINVILDESVGGTISLDLKDVSINKILEYIFTLTDLTYYRDGNTFIITKTSTAEQKALNKLVLKSIQVKYSKAEDVVDFLNSTLFNVARPGGNKEAVAMADARTNSIIILGNQQDIELAKRALEAIDFPLQRKTYFLKHALPSQVANVLNQTLFPVRLGSEEGGKGGSGNNQGANAAQGAGAAGGAGGGAGGVNQMARIFVIQDGPVTFIANDDNNTLTLIGTAEQIQLVESYLYDADIKPPQVAIQLSVISLTESKSKSYQPGINAPVGSGFLRILDNGGLTFSGDTTTIVWDETLKGEPTISQLLQSARIQATLSQAKGKILANPTVMAVSGSSSSINVTNEVFAGTKITSDPTTGLVQSSPILKSVGITLNITPQVMSDGTVTLTLSPNISAPSGVATDATGNSITLTSQTSLNIAQARVKDGETLILGGLINESDTSGVQKVPFLGDIPIIGGMFRASNTTSNSRSELIILVTPHIIKEEGVPYFRKDWKNKLSYTQLNAPSGSESYPFSSEKAIIPASHTSAGGVKSQTLQSVEQRGTDTRKVNGVGPSRSMSLPLSTFSEVLK